MAKAEGLIVTDYGFANQELSKADDKTLLRQHGLRGRPQGVDRATRQAVWEARSSKLNAKRDKWNRHSKAGRAVQNAGTGVAVGAGGALLAGHLRDTRVSQGAKNAVLTPVARHALKTQGAARKATGRSAKPLKLAAKAETAGARFLHAGPKNKVGWAAAAAGGALASAAGNRYRITANKKKAKWSSASGGIASGAAKRMKDYDVNKSDAFGVNREEIEKRYFIARQAAKGTKKLGEAVGSSGAKASIQNGFIRNAGNKRVRAGFAISNASPSVQRKIGFATDVAPLAALGGIGVGANVAAIRSDRRENAMLKRRLQAEKRKNAAPK